MNPFSYPEARHVRSLKPGPFRDYQSYKPYLRDEFARRCVYCRVVDGMKGLEAVGVDHYRPTSQFFDHEVRYDNLFYACNACNRKKGSFWPDDRQAEEGMFLPNPCDHRMAEHLFYRGAIVEPFSRTGLFAVELLQLNSQEDVTFRERMLRVIEHCWKAMEEVLKSLERIDFRLQTRTGTARDALNIDRDRLRKQLSVLQADLEYYTGTLLAP